MPKGIGYVDPLERDNSNADAEYYIRRAAAEDDKQARIANSPEAENVASFASLAAGIDVSAYTSVKEEYATTGDSPTFKGIRSRVAEGVKSDFKNYVYDTVNGDQPIEDMEAGITRAREVSDSIQEADPKTTAVVGLLKGIRPETSLEENLMNAAADSYLDIAKWQTEIEDILDERARELDPSSGKAFAEFVASGFLPGFQVRIGAIVNEVLPDAMSATDWLLPGNARQKLIDAYLATDGEGKVQMVKKIVEAIRTYAPTIPGLSNESITEYDMLTLLTRITPEDARGGGTKALLNVFGVLDVIPGLIGVGKAIHRRADKLKGTPIETLSAINAKRARAIMQRILTVQSEDLANILKVQPDQIAIRYILPKGQDEPIRLGPDLSDDSVLDYDVLNYDPLSQLLKPGEIASQTGALGQRIEEGVQEAQKVAGAHVHLSKTRIQTVGSNLEADMVIGMNPDFGFATYEDAMKVANSYGDSIEGSQINILALDRKTGNIVHVTRQPQVNDRLRDIEGSNSEFIEGAAPKNGEYFIQVNVKQNLDTTPEALGKFDDSDFVGATGRRAKYLTIGSTFGKWARRVMNVGVDREEAMAKTLGNLQANFNSLNNRQKTNVLSILDEEDKDEKLFSSDELAVLLGGDEKAIAGYRTMRDSFRVWRGLLNRRFRARLVNEGMKTVRYSVTSGEAGKDAAGKFTKAPVTQEVTVGREMSKGEASQVTHALNPDTGRIDPIDPEYVYNSGGFLVRTRVKVYGKGGSTDYILSKPNGNKVTIEELPDQVIRDIPGYVPRMYDAAYTVVAIRKSRHNGAELPIDVEQPVAILSNRGDAEAELLMKQQTNKDSNVTYSIVQSRELRRNDESLQAAEFEDLEYMATTGQLFFSKRGKELKPQIKSATGERSLKGVAESIDRARRSIARQVSLDPVVESLIARWEKTFGQDFGRKGGKIPLRGPVPKNSNVVTKEYIENHRRAIAMRDRIMLLAGIDEGTLRRNYSNLMVAISERVAKPNHMRRNQIAAGIIKAGLADPLSQLKQLAFLRYIIANPSRQVLLQSQQLTIYSGLEHGFSYMANGAFAKDWMSLASGLVFRDTAQWASHRKMVSKAFGMTERDYERSMDAFRKSGLTQGIDSHDYVAAWSHDPRAVEAYDTVLQGSAKLARDTYFNLTRFMRRIGFDAGEITQLMGAYLHAKNRWIKNNPSKASKWDSDDNLAEIVADARDISLNMNKADTSGFQKGLPGLAFQFFSHTTKSFQMLIPTQSKYGSKWLTNKEKVRIATIQAALYGPAGAFGFSNLWEAMTAEAGIEVPDEVNMYVEEGLLGTTVNLMAQAADDDSQLDSRVDFSSSVAPLSGTAGNILAPIEIALKAARMAGLDAAGLPIPDAGSFVVEAGNPLTKVFEAIALSPQGVLEFLGGAGLTAATDMYDRISQASFILGEGIDGEIPEDESAYAMAANEALRWIPAYNQTIQAIAARKWKEHYDSKDRPTTDASNGEIIFRGLFNLQPTRTRQQQEFLRKYNGVMLGTTEGTKEELSDAALTMYNRHLRLLQRMKTDEEVLNIDMIMALKSEMDALKQSVYPEQWMYMMNAMRSKMLSDTGQDGVTPRMISEVERALFSGAINPGSTAVDKIRNMAPFEGQAEIVNLAETLFNVRRDDQ